VDDGIFPVKLLFYIQISGKFIKKNTIQWLLYEVCFNLLVFK